MRRNGGDYLHIDLINVQGLTDLKACELGGMLEGRGELWDWLKRMRSTRR